VECQRARRLEKNHGHISHDCTYLLEIYHALGPGILLTQNVSISGMRDLLSTVFARFGSFLKKSVMDSPSSSILPAKRPRDHTSVPCPAPANSKRFRDATVLAPMVRSGNCESVQRPTNQFFQHTYIMRAPNLFLQVLLIDLQCPLDSCRCNMAPRSCGAPK